MNRNVWLALTLVMILSAMLLLVSCAKDAVQSQPSQTPQAQAPAADDKSMGEVEPTKPLNETAAKDTGATDFVNESVYFAFDSAVLSGDAQQILGVKAEYLQKNLDVLITVEGHCDERGTDAYNIALGEKRAKSAKDFLVNMGVNAARLNTVSYGEERPVAMGQDEASWAKNRRAQFVIN